MLAPALRLVAALTSAIAMSQAQQGEDTVVVLRSLAPLAVPSRQLPFAPATALPTDPVDEPQALDAPDSAPPPTWIVPLLQQRHRAALDDGSLQVDVVAAGGDSSHLGARLVVHGRRDRVDACVRDFDTIAGWIGRPIEVTAFRLPLGNDPLPAASWDPATVQQRLQAQSPLWTARARTRSGGAVRLADERGRGLVRDLDVEVAERAAILDPKAGVTFAGTRATLVVHALHGDELQLAGSWLCSEPIVTREHAIAEGRPSVHLPEHKTAYVSFAGRIVSGGALVVAGRGGPVGPDGFVLVLSARFLAPPSNDPAPDLLVRPVGAHLTTRSTPLPRGLHWQLPGDDGLRFRHEELDGGFSSDELLGLLQRSDTGLAELHGDVLVASGDATVCRRANRLLSQLAAAVSTGELRSRAVPSRDGDAPLELVQPLLGGRATAAFVGTERALVRDYEVEIASRSTAGNPVIGVARSGLWLATTAHDQGGSWHVTGSWSLAAHDEPRLHVHAETQPLLLHLPDYRTTTLPWDATMPLDQDHTLGQGPAWTTNGAPTQLTVRLTRR